VLQIFVSCFSAFVIAQALWSGMRYNYVCSIRVRSLQDQKNSKTFKRFFLPIFRDLSKTCESNQLSKNCECKHHFYPVISPVKSHPKMRLFVDFCENRDSINLFY
jgi:hypothetical protein